MRPTRLLTPVLLLTLAASPLLADWAAERKAYVDAFRGGDADQRAAAVEALRDFDHPEGAKLLLSHFVAEKNDRVIEVLARKICDLGSNEARETLRAAVLDESDSRRRAKFCRIFADGRGLDRVELLKKLLADRVPEVRVAAAAALGAPDSLLTRFVATLATDPVLDVRKAAVAALGRIATLEAVEPLIVVLEKEKTDALKAAAIVALHRITDRNFGANPEAWREWWRKHRAQDLTQVDRAITLGAEYLRGRLKVALEGKVDPKEPFSWADARSIPVVTYALIHAGGDMSDPAFKAGVEHIATKDPDGTYNASLMALALADLDPVKYRGRLAELAQILTDQQCTNGQWSYGGPGQVKRTDPSAPNEPPPDQESGAGGRTKKSKGKIAIVWHEGPRGTAGDNSNTQFAILGLRATMDAGCEIPEQVWKRSLDWFIKAQEQPYGGWGYGIGGAYWAMTCCGLTSVTICMHALGQDEAFLNGKPLDVERIKNGVDWLDQHWIKVDPRAAARAGGGWGFYYDLYSIERVGMIVGLETVGKHDWYAEGCSMLLSCQGADGSWGGNAIDTAFAILFLKRATRGFEISPQDEK